MDIVQIFSILHILKISRTDIYILKSQLYKKKTNNKNKPPRHLEEFIFKSKLFHCYNDPNGFSYLNRAFYLLCTYWKW